MNLSTLYRIAEVAQHNPALGREALGAALLIEQAHRRAGFAIQAGARQPKKLQVLSAQHYARRVPRIDAMHQAIVEELEKAQRLTLRRLKGHFAAAADAQGAPLRNSEGSGSGVAGDITFDARKFRQGLLGRMRDEARETLQVATEQAFEELGAAGYSTAGLDPFETIHPATLDYLRTRENMLADIPDEIHAQIEGVIREGLEGNKTQAQIARDIRENFREIEEARAATIASTETGTAYGFARQESFRELGVTHKRWLTSHLPTVRATHRDAEDDDRNQAVPMEEAFYVGAVRLLGPGLPFTPADDDASEIINCHCVALATEGPEDSAR